MYLHLVPIDIKLVFNKTEKHYAIAKPIYFYLHLKQVVQKKEL